MASGTAGGRIAPGVGANLIGQHSHDRNQDATVYVGNLDAQVPVSICAGSSPPAGPEHAAAACMLLVVRSCRIGPCLWPSLGCPPAELTACHCCR